MWHRGDYRAIFRHQELPDTVKIRDAMNKMWARGCVEDLSGCEGHAILSVNVLDDTRAMSTVIVQKRIHEGDLTAWATLGVGYSFCSRKDTYIKREGKQIAFERALSHIKEPHRAELILMWKEKASKSSRPLVPFCRRQVT
jgi:hypothetical protein